MKKQSVECLVLVILSLTLLTGYLGTIAQAEPWYMKPAYPDYAPSGMPDFDQRQGGTYIWMDAFGTWSHCGPVAVANSIWWFDSKFETNTITPPAIIDNYPLVRSYGPWDDHDPQNVQPFVEHLAYLMDTNGLRTLAAVPPPAPHSGTNVFDMQAGITHYLSWSGVNPLGDVDGDGNVTQTDLGIVIAAMGTTPTMPGWDMRADIFPVTMGYPPFADNIIDINDLNLVNMNLGLTGRFYENTVLAPLWELIVQEVMRCQDVVLLLVPWYTADGGQTWYRYTEGAHYVTVAGLDAQAGEILFSDPIRDNAEAGGQGEVPVLHAHMLPEPPYVTHNNASLVSHDMYHVIIDPCPGGPLTIPDYLGGAVPPPGPYPMWKIQIEAAVITCPYEVIVHDVAVTGIVTSKTGCLPLETVGQGYPLQVNVTVENQGTAAESFNVRANASDVLIGTQSVTLSAGETRVLTFNWDTTGVAYGTYGISADADIIVGETDTADNAMKYGNTLITLPGDVNGDGWVNAKDAVTVGTAFGSRQGQPAYNPNADINGDGWVNAKDAVILGGFFGHSVP